MARVLAKRIMEGLERMLGSRYNVSGYAYVRYGIGFGMAIFFLAASIMTYPMIRKNYDELLSGNDSQVQLLELLSLLQDAETGQRGFLLTGDDAYLGPYKRSAEQIPRKLEKLKQNAVLPEEQATLGRLEALYERKDRELQRTIEIRRTAGLGAAMEIVLGDEGRLLMDEIRSLVASLQTEQRAYISERADRGATLSQYRTLGMGLATTAVAVTALQIILTMNRNGRERQGLLETSQRNVEALEKSNEALNRANEELQHFAYVASHDLQEPLRSVSGYVQLLGRRYENQLDDQAHNYIRKSLAASQRMQQLIEDLLTYTRVSTQGRSFETVNTAKILDDTLANLNAAIRESGAAIRHSSLPDVRGDRVQIAQIFQNLIGNAIKFRGDVPVEIHVAAMREPGAHTGLASARWLFTVRDNGIGIAPEYQQRLFKIFQRLHTRQEYAGTGIGLAICKRIVERHGGRIWLESEPGKGTAFHFTLPATDGTNA